MRSITVVCGAGVSSTFLAQRIVASSQAVGREISVSASALSGLSEQGVGDVILLGPHLAAHRDEVAAAHPVAAVGVLGEDVLRALDGDAALALALELLVTRETSYGPPPPSTFPTDPPTQRRPSHG